MNSLQASKIVRAIMKSHGKQRIYNNLYPSMRSVKCFAGDAAVDNAMCEAISMGLLSQGVANFQIKRNYPTRKGWGPYWSVIVRLY